MVVRWYGGVACLHLQPDGVGGKTGHDMTCCLWTKNRPSEEAGLVDLICVVQMMLSYFPLGPKHQPQSINLQAPSAYLQFHPTVCWLTLTIPIVLQPHSTGVLAASPLGLEPWLEYWIQPGPTPGTYTTRQPAGP